MVVVGGGGAGCAVAHDRKLTAVADVTLVDNKDYFEARVVLAALRAQAVPRQRAMQQLAPQPPPLPKVLRLVFLRRWHLLLSCSGCPARSPARRARVRELERRKGGRVEASEDALLCPDTPPTSSARRCPGRRCVRLWTPASRSASTGCSAPRRSWRTADGGSRRPTPSSTRHSPPRSEAHLKGRAKLVVGSLALVEDKSARGSGRSLVLGTITGSRSLLLTRAPLTLR